MWPTVLSIACSVIAFLVSILAGWSAVQSARQLRALQERWKGSPASRITSLETALSETQDALETLANRVKMQRVRNAANHIGEKSARTNADPDPYREPDRWRDWMNGKLARARVGVD